MQWYFTQCICSDMQWTKSLHSIPYRIAFIHSLIVRPNIYLSFANAFGWFARAQHSRTLWFSLLEEADHFFISWIFIQFWFWSLFLVHIFVWVCLCLFAGTIAVRSIRDVYGLLCCCVIVFLIVIVFICLRCRLLFFLHVFRRLIFHDVLAF